MSFEPSRTSATPTSPDAGPTRGSRPRTRTLTHRRAGVASTLSVSEETVDRWNRLGLLPAPVKVNGVLLWGARELAEWVNAGCPDRKTWAPIWASIVRARRTARGR